MLKYLDYYIKVTLFLFLFFFSNSLVKFALSITAIMAIIGIIFLFLRYKKALIIETYKNITCSFKLSYSIFFVMIIISSLLINDIDSIKKAFKFLYYSLPFWIVLFLNYKNFIDNEKIMQKALMTAMFFLAICSLYFYFNLMDRQRLFVFNYGPNGIATILEINLPFIFVFTWNAFLKNKGIIFKSVGIITNLLMLFALAATGSRGALIGFVIGFVVLMLLNSKIVKTKISTILIFFTTLVIGFAVIFSVFYQNDFGITRSYDMERIRLIESSYNMWKDNKVLGVGLNNWHKNYVNEYILPEAKNKELEFPHNTIAYFFSTSGLIGGVGFIIFSIGILWWLIKNLYVYSDNIYIKAMLWAFIAFSIHGLVDAGFLMKQAERLIFMYLGITCASIIVYKKQ
ncbi:MAG: hypothetical protein DBY32_10930 [Phascolarctobacterium sp.]|nr:MAG: hypothetical protein DBY32_10930 [Phascolarctobacterium sp.]